MSAAFLPALSTTSQSYAGHVHAYERTAPVYDYLVDPCGAVHITIGDGGNSEVNAPLLYAWLLTHLDP